jgi:hypothetical protein
LFENLQKEVIEVNKKILSLCEKNYTIKELYKGCQIYFSPLVRNPDLMLIGINPGSGFYKANKNQIVQKFEPLEKYDEGYDLAQEVKCGVFRHLGRENIFNSTFKTNVYFFSTDNADKLKNFLKLLPEDLRILLKQKSIIWLKEIIKLVSPKLILCEGHTVFYYLKSFYGNEMTVDVNKGYVFEGTIDKIPIIGCKRMGCNIIKKEYLIEILKKYYL